MDKPTISDNIPIITRTKLNTEYIDFTKVDMRRAISMETDLEKNSRKMKGYTYG